MDIPPAVPIFSALDTEEYAPPGSPRTYTLAPLTYRERQAFRADHAREGGVYPTQAQILEALRQAVHYADPDNAPELLAVIDAAEADPDGENTAIQSALAVIEATLSSDPGYAALLAARRRWLGMLPWVAARHALRGWEGDGLPPFRRDRGAVPAELLDLLPEAEIDAIGMRAVAMMRPDRSAEGNSAGRSPSPATPELTAEG